MGAWARRSSHRVSSEASASELEQDLIQAALVRYPADYDPDKAKFHLDKSGIAGAEIHVAEVFPGMTDICLMLQRDDLRQHSVRIAGRQTACAILPIWG